HSPVARIAWPRDLAVLEDRSMVFTSGQNIAYSLLKWEPEGSLPLHDFHLGSDFSHTIATDTGNIGFYQYSLSRAGYKDSDTDTSRSQFEKNGLWETLTESASESGERGFNSTNRSAFILNAPSFRSKS